VANPENLLYSKDHEWAKIEGDTATVGITDYAQNSLGDIVYVELPRVGQTIAPHASIGVVESVKAVSELFSPVGGEVVEINPLLEKDPGESGRVRRGLDVPGESKRRPCPRLTERRRLRETRHHGLRP